MKKKNSNPVGALKRTGVYMKSSLGVIALALVLAALSAVMTIIGPDKIGKMATIMSDGLFTGIDLAAIAKIGVFLAIIYCLSALFGFIQHYIMAVVTLKMSYRMRGELSEKINRVPQKYFNTTSQGDILSRITNDVSTLQQGLTNSLPTIISAATQFAGCLIMMFVTEWRMALVALCITLLGMVLIVAIMSKSQRYFTARQKSLGELNGYVEEMVNGQKVVKVFCHEQRSIEEFDKINDALFEDSYRAHAYASVLGPIIGNIGNFLYVALALVGGVLLLIGVPNLSLSGKALDISILVPFLNMTKQFTGNINQLSQQINSIVMAGAGAQRVFSLIDEKAETDDGFVTLVDANIAPDGTITESDHHTGHWAWKNPNDNGKVSYRELRGDVRLIDVDFGYEPNKEVLHDVSVYAEPGQKVAFVGATGAGKTTITNLINRFYDIADGKIRYDGIDVSKIKKADLRRSLGIVLQDVNLFTGTVMDNIRYGKLNASDEECIAAAKLAGADDFITRLPQGYATELANNGANLSQGQRQLISIARAAVADPPVMILDEATSSIDTRTEAIVQRGMDQLMEGRTVFVIAHRLSTVKNSDVIMVLDHGRIIERGSHEKLIAEKGTYYQLYTGAFELE